MKKFNLNKLTAIVFAVNILLTIFSMMVKMGHFGIPLISKVLIAGVVISTGILMALILIWLVSNLVNYKK